jgi:hypothetical protein
MRFDLLKLLIFRPAINGDWLLLFKWIKKRFFMSNQKNVEEVYFESLKQFKYDVDALDYSLF